MGDEGGGGGGRGGERRAGWAKGELGCERAISTGGLAGYRCGWEGEAVTVALGPVGSELPISPVADNVNNPGDQ